MNSNWCILRMAAAALTLTASLPLIQAQQPQQNPAAPASPARPPSKLTPKQQITGFYATCKNGEAGKGLREMLSANPVVKPDDVNRVAQAFENLIAQMGPFVDFEILREKKISPRTTVIRCAAHFERQPFMNEFMFYDSGAGEWRLVHLRYDSNLATMFADEMGESESEN